MTMSDVEVAIAAARAGADVVLRNYGGDHSRQAKTDTDFATETDLDAERAILAVRRSERGLIAPSSAESMRRSAVVRVNVIKPVLALCWTQEQLLKVSHVSLTHRDRRSASHTTADHHERPSDPRRLHGEPFVVRSGEAVVAAEGQKITLGGGLSGPGGVPTDDCPVDGEPFVGRIDR